MIPLTTKYLYLWLEAFVLTQAVEMPIYTLLMHRYFGERVSRGQIVMLAFGASAITHPVVWFAFPWHGWKYSLVYGLAEAFAVATEAAYFWLLGVSPLRALLWAVGANAASVAVGELLRALGWM